jgi:EAL domain-containing protein (putative c-di-GMP-specific phosphodiesterase class I)
VAVDDEVRAQQGEMAWATRVASALEAGDLVLYAQPIAALARPTNRVHFEVLLRLVDRADGTIVAPGAFMPAAERYGLAPDIDRWVVSTAIAWLGQQPPEVIEQLDTIAINLSGVSMGSRTFERFLTDLLDQHASVAHHICFEITETAAVSNLDQAVSLIEQVQSRGASVALDDFGVGMSSLAYLKRLPVDYVKIDGQFVRDIATDPLDLAMVRSINDIAHLMGKQTIAEFVETESVLVLLRSLGVDHAQGYFIGKPAPLDTVISAASASTASPSRSMSSRPT